MNDINKITIASFAILFSAMLLFTSCDDEIREVVLYESGTLEAVADASNIMAGETVIFTDNSTKVYLRDWVFPGGTPATSTESTVAVTYAAGGDYTAVLNIVFVDNQKASLDFSVAVEGIPEPINPQPTFTESFALYTEYDQVSAGVSVRMEENNAFDIAPIIMETYEGSEAYSFLCDGSANWAMASVKPVSGTVDISAFADGNYNVALKSTSNGPILIRLQSSGQKAILTFDAANEQYGFVRDGQWHLLEIPIADFVTANSSIDLTAITDLLVFKSVDGSDVRSANNYDFYLDNFFLSK